MTPQLSSPNSFRKHWPLYATAGVFLLMIIILVLLGRRPFSESGRFLLWIGDHNSAETSQQCFDPYSITHALHGMILYGFFVLVSRRKWSLPLIFFITLCIEAAWEVAENSPFVINRYRNATMALGYTGDTMLNSVCDMISCALGCLLAWRLKWWLSIALAIGSEILLALIIRDNLTLNVIMLLFPIDAIKQWQLGG